jgi:hypothetical protein
MSRGCASAHSLSHTPVSLNCLIHGEVPEKMFTLKIDKTENVSTLKILIKENKASRLDRVDPSDLELWMVDLRLDDFGAEEQVIVSNLDTHLKLSPPRKKLSFFLNHIMDDDHLHIIAKTPGTLRLLSSWNRI